jgi:ATP-dependent Clp protease ATP-binding subunit ClpB
VRGRDTLDEYRKNIEKDPRSSGASSRSCGRAVGRGHDRDPAWPQGEIRSPPRNTDNGQRAGSRCHSLTRYITERFLPDKAIDLIDEAAARLRIAIDSLPQEIDEVERKITQLEIERQALAKEKDKASKERREKSRAGARGTA